MTEQETPKDDVDVDDHWVSEILLMPLASRRHLIRELQKEMCCGCGAMLGKEECAEDCWE